MSTCVDLDLNCGLNCGSRSRLVWPYKDEKGEPVPHGIQLVHSDLKRLESKDEFLNDTLIDFELM